MQTVSVWPISVWRQVNTQLSENVWAEARHKLCDSLSRFNLGAWSRSSWKRQLGAPSDDIDWYIPGPGLIRNYSD